MKLTTITEVTKSFGISTRTLRYYEQIGLLESQKKADYAYRTYDEAAVRRLQQILVLRKLRIPLKQVKAIFENHGHAYLIEVFQQNIAELDSEITALTTIRKILSAFISRLNVSRGLCVRLDLLQDDDILKIVEPLNLTKNSFKEEGSMDELNKANERLSKLADREVRIVYLPPAAVASIHCVGGLPEIESGNLLRRFMEETKLSGRKPDLRHYGFNNPNGNLPDGSDHGYERWVTIPEDLEVQPPFAKKHFAGGLYCAYMIPMGAFDEWARLYAWTQDNEKYELDFRSASAECECMEEHLDYIHKYLLPPDDLSLQLDLLLPIREKKRDGEQWERDIRTRK